MGVLLPVYCALFNALLWLGRVALVPVVSARAGSIAGLACMLVAPAALLGIALRVRWAPPGPLLCLSALSVALAQG